jgi:hypothetical protein
MEMKLIPPQEMGRKTYWCIKGVCKQSQELGLKSFAKTCMKVESKEVNRQRNINKQKKQQSK